MPQLGALIKSLAGKAGVKTDDETLKKLLGFSEAMQFELPEEFNNALERNLLTAESAMANPDVRSRIFAEALNGVDSEFDKFVNDFGFDDSFKGDYKTIQKNTNEKFRRISAGIKKQIDAIKEEAKKPGKSDAEVSVLKTEIEKLNRQAEDLKRLHQTEIANLQNQNTENLKTFTLKSTLAGKPLPKNGLASEINILTAQTLVNQAMAKEGLSVLFNEAGMPVLKKRENGADIDYFVNNKKVEYSDFIDGVLAQNKFIQVNDPNATGGTGNTPPAAHAGGPQLPSNDAMVQSIQNQISQLTNGTIV
ncbi:MAG TPA: hypothetical protein PL045_06220 [Chitinophagaceae bacterium]|nr:hypothetical protein [Chitinophagaceae bacterium]